MMKKKSFLLIIIAVFWVCYILLSFAQTVYTTADRKEENDINRLKRVEHLLSVAQTLVMTGNTEALKDHLDGAVQIELINFYCIKDKDTVLFEYSGNQVSGCEKAHDRRIASYGTPLKYTHQIVKPIKIGDQLVSVGFATDFKTYFWESQKYNIGVFIKDVFIITGFLGFLVYLVMKDFLMLDRLLQKGGKGDISKIKARSKEAQTLIDSTSTLDRLNSEQSHMIHHLQNTVGLAIHSEIDNKTAHLTQIPSAVVRIDLNGYTQIFLEKKEEHIVSVLNEYFSVTNDLIKRFSGEIYQIIGDEIIFVLKNQDPRSALFCVRAIFEWARELDRKIQDQHKHRFLLKASISYGSLKFVQLNNGYAFAGVPLIESVRLLGCVSDKSENTLILKREDADSAWPFIKNHYLKGVDLKGFEEKSEIIEIKEFVSLEEFFNRSLLTPDEHQQRETMRSLTYFRGQSDVTTALQMLNWNLTDQKWTECFYLVQHLKDLRLGIKSESASKQLFQILSDHFQLITSKSMNYPFLNSVVLMTESLVHPDLWTGHWTVLMKNYLLCTHARIVANATEVLCHFGFSSTEMQAILLNWKDNNRISANFLLSEMKKSIAKPNVKTILSWLESTNILFQASALYVIEETLKHYQLTDPVVFKTNTLLADCVSASNKLKNSENPLIKGRIEKLQMLLIKKETRQTRVA
jgi:adenylate cyclase